MAAAQALRQACNSGNQLSFHPFASKSVSYKCDMGSVSSLIERQDFSPDDLKLDFKPLQESHSPGNFLKRGLHQRELLTYLNITKKDGRSAKKFPSGLAFRREHSVDGGENEYPVLYHKDRRGADFSKTSLPERGRFEKSQYGPSGLRSSNVKNFMSMQSLCSSSGHKLSKSNGSLNTLGSMNSPPRRGPVKSNNRNHHNHQESENDDDSLSDSRQNSINSFNTYSPGFSVAKGQISSSMGHINHIGGSLDRASRVARDSTSGEKTPLSCKSMAALSRLQCSGEPPPPYEYSQSVEDVARQLEEKLHDKGMETRRTPSDSEDPFTKVFEDKRRLWMEELDELKQMYMCKLQQISQQALRSQRALQLQLYKVQQEKKRLQEELSSLRGECDELRQKQSQPENLSPKLEESKWEISQKAGEISLLKQQLRDSQAEITQKLGEVFNLKTKLREANALAKDKEKEAADLALHLQAVQDMNRQTSADSPKVTCGNPCSDIDDSRGRCLRDSSESVDLERLRAELMLERRQNEAQILTFETERKVWKEEKDKVLKYQKEIQASYLEMYHRNQTLERQLQELRQTSGQSPTTPSVWMNAVETFQS
ncbi:NEDD4-binding protein 3 [Bombina bombina]|uniref:NEDD4-binding protein 3 n=1 Tax=Bombina bombina TaxID=8345 RepID=UPI00235A7272|nr:NEDD4-binding protein 3 [Bombina bombina]